MSVYQNTGTPLPPPVRWSLCDGAERARSAAGARDGHGCHPRDHGARAAGPRCSVTENREVADGRAGVAMEMIIH
ncbi:unnamed protein product [Arctogadus glacialis]